MDRMVWAAYNVFSDGQMQEALWYAPGPDGFVIAKFDEGMEFNTEVLNSDLVDGKFKQEMEAEQLEAKEFENKTARG